MKLLVAFFSLCMSVCAAWTATVILLLVVENDWQGNLITAALLFVICVLATIWFFRIMTRHLYAIQRENESE